MTGKSSQIKSVSDFGEWVAQHGKRGVLYRGLADSEYQLESSLYRRLQSPKREISQDIFIRALDNLIKIAKREKHDRKDGHVLSDLELLSNLQHYGAATCLIDFTRNPLVALWFACQPHHKTENGETNPADGKIVAVNANHPEKFGIAEGGEEIENFFSDKKLWKWIPPKQNHRIVAQQSVFVLGQSVIPEDEMLASCIISHESKDSILLELQDRYGISAESLFCDFPGFAREVHGHDKEYHEWTVKDYFQFGIDSYQKGRYEDAIKDYDQAIILNPQYADAYNNRGIVKDDLGDFAAAIADYDEAIKLNPKYANAYYNRGIAKDNLGEYAAAAADFSETIRLNPKDADTYYNRGNAKTRLGEYTAAIADYDEVIRLNPKDAAAYNNRGNAKSNLGDHTAAIADYDEVIRLNPKDAAVYNNRGNAKVRLGDYNAAIADYDQAIKLNPEYADAYYNRGVAKGNLGDHTAAVADFSESIKLNPEYAKAYYNRGITKLKLDDKAGALEDFRRANELDPEFKIPKSLETKTSEGKK